MNKALRVSDYLAHILKAIERINRYTTAVDELAFLHNDQLQDAVIRNLEVIGEAANNIQKADPAFASAHAEVPWEVMYAMRNRLSHGYDKIDLDMVWRTVCNDLPDLRKLISSLRV